MGRTTVNETPAKSSVEVAPFHHLQCSLSVSLRLLLVGSHAVTYPPIWSKLSLPQSNIPPPRRFSRPSPNVVAAIGLFSPCPLVHPICRHFKQLEFSSASFFFSLPTPILSLLTRLVSPSVVIDPPKHHPLPTNPFRQPRSPLANHQRPRARNDRCPSWKQLLILEFRKDLVEVS